MNAKAIHKVIIPVVMETAGPKRVSESAVPWCVRLFLRQIRQNANIKGIVYTQEEGAYDINYKLTGPSGDRDKDQPGSVPSTLQPAEFFTLLTSMHRRIHGKSRDGVRYDGYALGFNAASKFWVLIVNVTEEQPKTGIKTTPSSDDTSDF